MPPNDESKLSRLRRAMYSRSVSGTLRPRDRRELEVPETTVPTDFVTQTAPVGGSTVAPMAIGLARSALRWMLVGAVTFFVVAVGIFTYYFFFGAGSVVAAPGNVDISVRGPVTVSGGERAEFQIVVTNRNQSSLQLADLVITYPPGTRSPNGLGTDLPVQRESLGTIEPGGSRQGTVTAVMVGTEGEHASVHVEVEYRVANSSAIFVASTDYEVIFSTSPISVAVDANNEAVAGQPFEFTITVSSNARSPVKDALLAATVPFGFTVKSSDPAPSSALVWELGDINPGDNRVIHVRGTLEGEQSDDRIFTFTVGTRSSPTSHTIDVALSKTVHHVAIAKPFIGLTLGLAKETAGDTQSYQPGDTVNLGISYVNNLTSAVDDAIIVARLSGLTIDGQQVRTTDGFYRSSDGTVLWDKDTTHGVLTHLNPGDKGTVHVSFVLPDSKTLATSSQPVFNIVVHVAGKRVDQQGVPETLQATASTTLKIGSSLQFLAQGFYNQNPFKSSGPLPPKVDQETTYAIVWALTNTSNTIKNGKITASLPPYARWIGVHIPASENVTFNATDGTVTWDVGDVKPAIGVNGGVPRQMAFEIGLTPSASQVGQEPALITNETFMGTDSFTGININQSVPDVTTNIINDQGFSTTQASVVQ